MKSTILAFICLALASCKANDPGLTSPVIQSEEARITSIVRSKDRKDIESLFLGIGLDPEGSRTIRDQVFRRLSAGIPDKTQIPVEVSIRPITSKWKNREYGVAPTYEIAVALRRIEGGNMILNSAIKRFA